MKITKYAAAIAIGLTCFAGQASATDSVLAQVGALQGSVAINHGGVITPASASTVLAAGDRIVSMDGSAAQIKFADGCTIDVKANAMATVGSASPCAATGLVGQSSPMQFDGFNGFWGAFAIFAVGAIIIAAYASSKDNDHEVLSP
ncbi:MAG: hypothetical protein JWO33_2747 [Caulobacteraceae bacterium]|nr:hypothetical protein [Caulobacteraceae bacterium]